MKLQVTGTLFWIFILVTVAALRAKIVNQRINYATKPLPIALESSKFIKSRGRELKLGESKRKLHPLTRNVR